MAIIPISSSTISTLASEKSSASLSISKRCASLSSLQVQFPVQLRRQFAGSITALPRNRILPRIEATKQTFSSFDELITKSDKPVLVDFYAVWCGPCQFMVPILEEVAVTMKDKILVEKIDTEKYSSIADKYAIQALPTFILFKDGEPCERFEGAMPAEELMKRVEAALVVKQ